MERHYVECQCSDFNHVFRFVLDEQEGDVWLEVQLNVWLPWYKRLYHAVRYAFGKPKAYGHYDVTLLRDEDFLRLHVLLDKAAVLKCQRSVEGTQKNP